jgi:UDP:flavonoid glycosyltransferase YjiC (YdhE family)
VGHVRVIVAYAPGAGHFHTVLPAYETLLRHGHEAILCGSPEVAADAGEAGVPVTRTGLRSAEEGFRICFGDGPRTRHHDCVMPVRSFQDLSAVIDSWGPDLVVRETTERGAALAAERAGLPCVDVVSCADAALRTIRRREDRQLAVIRRRVGLRPRTAPPGSLVAFGPPEFFGPADRKEPVTHFRYRPADHRRPPARAAGTRRGALVSFGTFVAEPGPRFWTELVRGLHRAAVGPISLKIRDEAIRTTVATAGLPVVVRPWVDLLDELAGCRVFVCHGSANSTLEALHYGVPPLVIPTHNDTYHVATTCVRENLGRALRRERVDADAVRRAVVSLLADPDVPHRIRAFQKSNAALPGEEEFVAHLSGMVHGRRKTYERA